MIYNTLHLRMSNTNRKTPTVNSGSLEG